MTPLDGEGEKLIHNDEAVQPNDPLEYAQEDSQMQALGPARDSKADKLESINFAEDVDVEISDEPLQVPDQGDTEESGQVEQTDKPSRTKTSSKNEERNQVGGNTDAADTDMDMDGVDFDPSDDPQLSPDEQAEAELKRWLQNDQPASEAPRIWQLYDSLTQSLSFTLCEQLRLILEPTKASRLMGDFRTGKRLNMKKIVPYIASNYTKDKIWLRRVKPSQREYQVLIALDDSRSMAESHSIHLAFQTLALVSKALNRLEVGDIAVAKFGVSTEVLHGFDDGPFSDQTGTRILENFRFQQNGTNVGSLLEVTFAALMRARERRGASSSSADDLWQLEIVISDGICQNHDQLKALLRKAEEERVLVVFLVIDAPAREPSSQASTANTSENSIMNMNQASYALVNGQMELKMQRYMDTFPFEYFVVLKNVESLPDVLCDTLRQFFERISLQ